ELDDGRAGDGNRKHFEERLVSRLRRILNVAIVSGLVPGAQATLEDDAVPELGVYAEVVAKPVVVDIAPREECVRQLLEVVGRGGSVDVVEARRKIVAGQLLAAGRGRRRWNQRLGDAVLREVARRDRPV